MRAQAKNYRQANKGKFLEEVIERSNLVYQNRGQALVQKIPTPTKVKWSNGGIVGAYHSAKSTLDFRGTLKGGRAIAFDCKETQETKGLPLKGIAEHQIDYIRQAMSFEEMVFIICYIKPTNKYYLIPGQIVLDYWEYWQKNKGKRGCNCILIDDMIELTGSRGVPLDYLLVLEAM